MNTILDRIAHIANNENISIGKLERVIGASKGVLSRAIANKSDIQSKWIIKIVENYPQYSGDWLLTGRGDSVINTITPAIVEQTFPLKTDRKIGIQDIPLYDISATAGMLAIFNDNHIDPEDYLRVPNLPPVDGAIYVRGESMVPLLKSGDIIIYKKLECSLDSILWGQIYLLSFMAGGETFTVVKYLQKSELPGYIKLVSQNEHFQPKDIPLNSIHALALVKASITFHTIE